MESVPYLGQTLSRWRVGASTFLALPELGARLVNWNVTHADGTIRDVIYWPELSTLDEVARVRGGNPILFPFNARTFHQGAIHQWKDPEGRVRPMPMHGIARQGKFRVTHSHELGFTAVLEPDAAAHEAYPYAYEFAVTYRFSPTGLSCEFSLENRDQRPIPWSAGHHFYFTLPWHKGLHRRDYRLHVPARKHWRHAADGKLVNFAEMKGVVEADFDDPRLLDCIFTALKSSEVRFGPRSGEEDVVVRVGEEPIPDEWATVVSWTESPESPFFCVEPWMGAPNSPTHGKGLRWVEPGATDLWTCEVALA